MENKGKQKYNPRDDMSLDQAILQWIVDDYDIPDEKSRKIVGESGKKSKLITCKMVMDYLDNRGVVEETDETEFMRALRKRLYYAIDTVVGPIPMKLKSIDAHELLRQKKQAKGRFHVTSANAEFFMYLLWCNEDRADNDDILWLIKNERSYEASEWLKNLVRDGFNSLVANSAIGIKQKTIERRWKELFEGELYKTKEAFESLKLTWSYIEDRKKIAGGEFDKEWFDLRVRCCLSECILYYHNEYYYTQLDSNQLIKLYRQNVDYELNNKSSLRGYKDLYDCLVTDPQIECSEPEDEPIYAPLENGILDLMEWKLYPHSPDQITFTCIKAKYDPQAKCQIFEEYLQRVTGGDFLLSKRVWMAIGYLLIYPARGKFFIFMKGIGNSGKSVLGSFIRRLYPKESISSIRLKQMKNEFGMASLANAVINFDMDMPSSKIDEEAASRLKQITGGDSINVPRKFRDDALLERRIKFVFSSNHPLIIDGEDDALLKRIIYLPFNYAIPDDQQDPYLGEKIWKERDAIVTKALRYARKLVQLNYIFPEIPQVDNVKCIVRDSIAKTVGKFIQESCDRSEPKAVTATEDLYNAYSDYCKEKNMCACSKKAFTQELTQRGIKHTRFRCIGEDMIARKNPVSAFQGIKPRP